MRTRNAVVRMVVDGWWVAREYKNAGGLLLLGERRGGMNKQEKQGGRGFRAVDEILSCP